MPPVPSQVQERETLAQLQHRQALQEQQQRLALEQQLERQESLAGSREGSVEMIFQQQFFLGGGTGLGQGASVSPPFYV